MSEEIKSSGWVNFPIDDPKYFDTKEGGMFVRLVVVDMPAAEEYKDRWIPCHGGYQNFILDESIIHDDKEGKSAFEYHFPYQDTTDRFDENTDSSIDYLAIITLGGTTWSGCNRKSQNLWFCTYDDLTSEGKKLYRQIQKLYPHCDLHLQTFLDT